MVTIIPQEDYEITDNFICVSEIYKFGTRECQILHGHISAV